MEIGVAGRNRNAFTHVGLEGVASVARGHVSRNTALAGSERGGLSCTFAYFELRAEAVLWQCGRHPSYRLTT